jgi:hypothetical protein
MHDVLTTLTTCLVLLVGLSLVYSIMRNRLATYIGVCLTTTTAHIQFPQTKSIELTLKKSDKPKLVILKFAKSTGFYGGEISLKNGGLKIASHTLPILPEYRNKFLGFYNEDIPRQTNTVVMSLPNYKTDLPLTLDLSLNHNVQDPKLRKAMKVTAEEDIEIFVRGKA